MLTTTANGVFHITQFPDGHYHLTGTQTGTFEFDTDDPALPDFSGRFTVWFGENGNPNGFNGRSRSPCVARARMARRFTFS